METGKRLRRFGIGMLVVGMFALGGCADKEVQGNTVIELQESALNAPQKTEVTRGDMQVVQYYDAQVGPKVKQLTFAKEGTFGKFCVQLGDAVRKGDILATPAMENIEKAIENKEKELEALTTTYNYRKASLENEIAIVEKELENVYAILETLDYLSEQYTATCQMAGNYDQQRMRLELQMKQLQETYELELPHCEKQLKKLQEEKSGNLIRAPFDGNVVALAETQYGDYINTNTYYVAIADTSVEYARCEYINLAVLKQMERAVFWKDGEEYETVTIPMDHDYYLETMNNNEKAYLEFEVSDPDEKVGMGDYGKLKLIMKEKKNVLLIPEIALQYSDGKYYVYKDVDGEHKRVDVKIDSTDGINVEIVEGLEEGDVVYVQE